jgi:hypothetical protein
MAGLPTEAADDAPGGSYASTVGAYSSASSGAPSIQQYIYRPPAESLKEANGPLHAARQQPQRSSRGGRGKPLPQRVVTSIVDGLKQVYFQKVGGWWWRVVAGGCSKGWLGVAVGVH